MFNVIKNLFKKTPGVNSTLKILVIEDNPVDQRIVEAAIKQGGYTPITAADGKTGIEYARIHQPDLIVLDYNLPDTTGPEVCLLLKHDSLTNKIPVLFLTSLDAPSNVIECYDKGGDHYLYKPISPKLLLKYINDLLNDKTKDPDHA